MKFCMLIVSAPEVSRKVPTPCPLAARAMPVLCVLQVLDCWCQHVQALPAYLDLALVDSPGGLSPNDILLKLQIMLRENRSRWLLVRLHQQSSLHFATLCHTQGLASLALIAPGCLFSAAANGYVKSKWELRYYYDDCGFTPKNTTWPGTPTAWRIRASPEVSSWQQRSGSPRSNPAWLPTASEVRSINMMFNLFVVELWQPGFVLL